MKKIFIGIDFSKEKFDVTAILEANASSTHPYKSFKNNKTGFKEFKSWMTQETGKAEKDDILLCGENTGIYSQYISDMLYAEGYTMWLESALQIKRSMGIQRIKSDKADSRAIAEYAMRFQDRMVAYEPERDSLRAIRELFMYRAHLVKEKTGLRIRAKEKTSKDSKTTKALRFLLYSSDMIVRRLDKEIRKCDEQIRELIMLDEEIKENYEIITSVKGIGLQNAAVMLVYTNNFARFDYNPRKLACYYGVAPFGKESGTSVHVKPHTSPLAKGQLKALLSEAVQCSIIHCKELREYYQRLLAKGKKPMVALNNVKNKLLHIIMAMVRNKQKYNPNVMIEMAEKYTDKKNIVLNNC